MRKHPFGRLYARRLLSNCIFVTCIEYPYPNLTDDSDLEDTRTIKAMMSWNRQNWNGVQKEFQDLRDLAVRKDTKNTFNFLLDDAGIQKLCNPGDIDEKLNSDTLFNNKADRLQKRIKIQTAIAPIREQLEIAVANKSEPNVYQDDIDDVMYVTTPCASLIRFLIVQSSHIFFSQTID